MLAGGDFAEVGYPTAVNPSAAIEGGPGQRNQPVFHAALHPWDDPPWDRIWDT